ncbi:DUF58 domain-containing protein [Schaalia sp. Marseille-Q2122]|uniref:DUF58 domain-containing protein n=1 Tax=Schaalia sp. Marseille-Q2122 TaxID=2736604 RepID=UPI00158C78F0|nr:DUF58 domain-containing protein [Schaalia sp. Marseille-Q2122]
MALSWRAALLAALGLPLTILFPSRVTAWAWLLCVAALSLIDTVAAQSPRMYTLERHVIGPIRADQTTTSTVTVRSPFSRVARIEVRDAWPPSLRPSPAHHRGTLASSAPATFVTTLAPERRGVRQADYVTVRVWGPLGLAARQVSVAVPCSLDVLPEFRSRRLIPSRLARLQELEGSSAVILRGPGTEFDSLRDYVRGDDPRDIDWRASARSDDLVVRTWRPERDRHVVIVVDTGRASALLLGAPQASSPHPQGQISAEQDRTQRDTLDLGVAPRLDAGIEAALLMEALADKAGDKVHFLAIDRQVRARVSGLKGASLLNATARALQEISPSLEPIDWQLVAGEVRRTVRQRSLVLLLTEIPPVGTDPEFLEAVSQLTASHTVVVASANDPTVPELLAARETSADIYTAAAASALAHEGAAGVVQVRRVGAITVSEDAGLLAARTADTYIDLKRQGIL